MFNRENVLSSAPAGAVAASFFPRVYGWMTAGLGLTALVALFTLSSQSMLDLIFGNRMVFYGLIIAELGLVIALSAAIQRISAATATLMFLLYSALSGVTFSAIFMVYTRGSIASTFFVAAGTFPAMSLYGMATKRDLTGWGSFFFMGLIGIVIASVVNIFLQSEMIYWVTSYIGVFVFVGLTAYDTQKLKMIGQAGFADGESRQKEAILGALRLYLDFINLFLMLLRVMGNRR
ncbi:Bax inhibitor-1/YccA family protein [Desulfuromonas sp. TF]|uniref:Bax inhibitor-1/YccA family protein n=1 Tax=Desulfuromonas sp. TF TaxID=1232410 RepID=UPI00041C87C3|nr:Bax inhibitor-1/YccA family protein [Desulfuromonas sp. TF]